MKKSEALEKLNKIQLTLKTQKTELNKLLLTEDFFEDIQGERDKGIGVLRDLEKSLNELVEIQKGIIIRLKK